MRLLSLTRSFGLGLSQRKAGVGFSTEMLDLFLFYGRMSDVVGGEMPNLVGSDFITVAGSAGAETFQVPDTAAYIAADTEYFWFQINETPRTVTFAEATGYDTQRTVFKYDSYSPYTIREIVILKPTTTLTSDQINKIMAVMDLNPFWTGTWRDYGSIKENRALDFTPWEPIIWDEDALAFATSTAIDNLVIEDSINELVKGLKTYSLWDKVKALWPMAGYTAFTHKWNLKDPRDLDAAFRLADTGSVNHNLNGMATGSNASFANTFFNPSTQLSAATNASLFLFTPSNVSGATYKDMGVSIGALYCMINVDQGSNLINSQIGGNGAIYGNTGGTSAGFSVVRKNGEGVAGASTFKNGADKRNQNYPAGATLPNGVMYLGNTNVDGTPGVYNHRAISLAGVAESLTDQECIDLSTVVAAYRTAISGLPVDQPLPDEYMEMSVVQPASLQQFKLFYKLTAGADIWLDWGYGDPIKLLADGTEQFTATSVYPTNNTTYSMKLYGDSSKILTVKFTEATSLVVNGTLTEVAKLTNLEVLYLGCGTNWSGAVTSLPSTLKELHWTGGAITGSINDLPDGMTYLYILMPSYEAGLSGSLNLLPSGLTSLTLNLSNFIYGSVIPAGVTYLHLNGLRNVGGNGNITLNIDDFNADMTYCYLNDLGNGITGDGYIQGDFANFPAALEMLWLDNLGQLITGSTDDLPATLTKLGLLDLTTSNIYIDIENLPAGLTELEIKNPPSGRTSGSLNSLPCRAVVQKLRFNNIGSIVTGNIESLTATLLNQVIINDSQITYGGGATPAFANVYQLTVQTAMSSATVDALIAAIATSQTGTVTGTYTFSNARTSASDADVSDLLANHNKTIVTANE